METVQGRVKGIVARLIERDGTAEVEFKVWVWDGKQQRAYGWMSVVGMDVAFGRDIANTLMGLACRTFGFTYDVGN